MMCIFLSEFPVNDQEAQMRVLCVFVKHDALTEIESQKKVEHKPLQRDLQRVLLQSDVDI